MLCLLSSTLSVRIAIETALTEGEDGHATGPLSWRRDAVVESESHKRDVYIQRTLN